MNRTILAQITKPLGTLGGEPGTGMGPWSNIVSLLTGDDVTPAALIFTDIISRIITIMVIVAGIWFVFMFIAGAYGFLTAGGDSKKMGEAASRITSALIGLVIIVAAYALISLLGDLLGFEVLEPQKFIPLLGPGG